MLIKYLLLQKYLNYIPTSVSDFRSPLLANKNTHLLKNDKFKEISIRHID